jgi:hypothetical protein
MNKYILSMVAIASSMAALSSISPARAEMGTSVVGASLLIGGGTTSIGLDSKFGVSETLSVRPFLYFPSGGTIFGTGLTYDFQNFGKNPKVKITPFLGGGIAIGSNSSGASATTAFLTAGADFAVTPEIELKASLDIPFNSTIGVTTTSVKLGGGYRF